MVRMSALGKVFMPNALPNLTEIQIWSAGTVHVCTATKPLRRLNVFILYILSALETVDDIEQWSRLAFQVKVEHNNSERRMGTFNYSLSWAHYKTMLTMW